MIWFNNALVLHKNWQHITWSNETPFCHMIAMCNRPPPIWFYQVIPPLYHSPKIFISSTKKHIILMIVNNSRAGLQTQRNSHSEMFTTKHADPVHSSETLLTNFLISRYQMFSDCSLSSFPIFIWNSSRPFIFNCFQITGRPSLSSQRKIL
jgi:hypothetical protein